MGRGRSRGKKEPSGILLVDKPAGMTSHDVVYKVRKAGFLAKVGHTGTLDPFATGVLPLCINRATRLAQLFSDGDKGYQGTFRLGAKSDTQDLTGEIVEVDRDAIPQSTDVIQSHIQKFMGEIDQLPPMYSAVKVDGKRLYELARQGIEVERKPRRIHVHRYEIDSFEDDLLTVDILASKGTYIRTLAEDLGQSLGCGAYVEALRRTQAGPFTLADCLPLDEVLTRLEAGEIDEMITPLDGALAHLPRLNVREDQRQRLSNGGQIYHRNLLPFDTTLAEGEMCTVFCGDELMMVGKTTVPLPGEPSADTVIFKSLVVLARPAPMPPKNKRSPIKTAVGGPPVITRKRSKG